MSNKSYDDIFKSYSENSSNNKKKRQLHINWRKIIIILLIIVIIAGISTFIYLNKDTIKDKITEIIPQEKESTIEVDLLDTELSLIVGDTKKLDYQITEGDDSSLLTFSSSDTSIIKVDKEGNIKAIGAGEARLLMTYTSKNGVVTKICNVSVKNTDVENLSGKTEEIEKELEEQLQKQQEAISQEIAEENKKRQEEMARKAAEQYSKHQDEMSKKAAEGAAKAAQKAAEEAAKKNK